MPLVQQPLTQGVRVSKDAKQMGFSDDLKVRLGSILEFKYLMERAMQQQENPDCLWSQAKLNPHQSLSARKLVEKLMEDGTLSPAEAISKSSCKQLHDWCVASAGELQKEASKKAKEKIASERRLKRIELSDPTNGFKNMMSHVKKSPGSGIPVIAREDGSLTSDRQEMLERFAATWSCIYSRLRDQPPSFDAFATEFGQFVENPPTGDLCPTVDQLYAKATSARDASAPGMDGWKPSELKKLPRAAWLQRHRLLLLIKSEGRWPLSYLRVSAPSLRKVNRLDPDALRSPPEAKDVRLLSIYTQLYRIEAGAWFANHVSWLAEHVHPGCLGGMRGLEALMASWDTQSNMAEATCTREPSAMAFLDYYKFFDSFHPGFFGDFLSCAGIHSDFVRLFVHLNTNSQRFVKIADTFSAPIRPFNALGRGDPWVLIAAILYVSLQFRMISHFAQMREGLRSLTIGRCKAHHPSSTSPSIRFFGSTGWLGISRTLRRSRSQPAPEETVKSLRAGPLTAIRRPLSSRRS